MNSGIYTWINVWYTLVLTLKAMLTLYRQKSQNKKKGIFRNVAATPELHRKGHDWGVSHNGQA